ALLNKDSYARRVVRSANNFFSKKFRAVPFQDRILFLPYCLRPTGCPTIIDNVEGLLCSPDCVLSCKLRETKELALRLGYRDARIVVSGKLHKKEGILRSKDFLIRHIETLQPRAVIGCLCTNDLCRKYLHPDNLSADGTLGKHGLKVIPQVILLDRPNCRQSTVDWQTLQEMIQAGATP
ncbi:MAG: DUF116 domain-containing protein, partial [Desulfobulbaceae bacterium]|nr:DUF116 domain-containing protein [Desulfobulbaceae bacterium]